jgi:flavin-dependent dehydrogenase
MTMTLPPHDQPAIAATITMEMAAAASWQVIVIGAGPAGAATALGLAARGVRVLLIDRHAFPRFKVCGCCLSVRAVDELGHLGLASLVEGVPVLATVRLLHRARAVRIPLPHGRVMSRERLDARLVQQAIAVGCHWLPKTRALAIDDGGPAGAIIRLATDDLGTTPERSHPIASERVVLTTGLTDQVRVTAGGEAVVDRPCEIHPRSRIGIGGVLPADACDLPSGELVMAVGRDGYCGTVRLDDGRIDMAAAIDRRGLSHGKPLAEAVTRILAEATGGDSDPSVPTAERIHAGSFRATPQLTRRAPLVAGASRRLFRAGDAAGYVEPFTGEGIGWALSSARMLVAAMVDGGSLRPAAEAARVYARAYRRGFAAVHARCLFVAGSLRRGPIMTAAVAVARGLPRTTRALVPLVIGGGSPGAIE